MPDNTPNTPKSIAIVAHVTMFKSPLDPPPGPPINPDGTFASLPEWPESAPRPVNWPSHIHPPRHVQHIRNKRPHVPAVITSPREPDSKLIVRAFLDSREGYSADYVVACAEANMQFLKRVRQLGVGGTDAEVNHWLLNARKAGKLKGEPTETEYRLIAAYEPWIFASEWAGRHLQRELVGEVDRLVALDDILCNPSYAARFDEIAARVKPGFKPLDYRWAAFAFRKRSKSKPAARDLKVSLERQMTLDDLFGGAPHGPGIYLIKSGEKPVYVNHAVDLNAQISRHSEIASGHLVPDWLSDGIGRADQLSYAFLEGVTTDRLREARISSVAKYRPWLNLLDLEGAA